MATNKRKQRNGNRETTADEKIKETKAKEGQQRKDTKEKKARERAQRKDSKGKNIMDRKQRKETALEKATGIKSRPSNS